MIVSLYSNVARSLRHSNGHERDAFIWPDVNHDDQWKWKEVVFCRSLSQSGSLGHPARAYDKKRWVGGVWVSTGWKKVLSNRQDNKKRKDPRWMIVATLDGLQCGQIERQAVTKRLTTHQFSLLLIESWIARWGSQHDHRRQAENCWISPQLTFVGGNGLFWPTTEHSWIRTRVQRLI